MKNFNPLLRFLLSPWFLAAVWGVLLIWLLPDFEGKYGLTQISSNLINEHERDFIDNITFSDDYEHVMIGQNSSGNACLKVRSKYGHSHFQANLNSNFLDFTSKYQRIQAPLIKNLNHSKEKEIVFPTMLGDSLLINVYDYNPGEFIIKELFIDTIGNLNNDKKDFSFTFFEAIDVNSDGILEVFFDISAGFALYPRKIYRVNIADSSVRSTINTGINYGLGKFTKNKKGEIRLGVGSYSSNNCREDFSYPYPDTKSYACVFNSDLEFVFEPLAFSGAPTTNTFLNYDSIQQEYTFFFNAQNSEDSLSQFFTLNEDGKYKKILSDSSNYNLFDFYGIGDYKYLVQRDLNYYELDVSTRKITKSKFSKTFDTYKNVVRLEGIGNSKFHYLVYNANNDEYLLIDERYPNPLSLKAKGIHLQGNYGISYYSGEKECYIGVQDEKFFRIFKYYVNPFYWIRYPAYLGIYLIFVLFFYLITQFQAKRYQSRYEERERLNELQLTNYRNQLNPHFAFNALNTVGNAILNEKRIDAYQQFVSFSKLLRIAMDYSNDILIPLEEELDFSKRYLDFQLQRFPNRFVYKIEKDAAVSEDLKIPKMVIQGAAENAMKHGFSKIDSGGLISIQILKENKSTMIKIFNNGQSLESAKEEGTTNRGIGTKVIKEQLAWLKKQKQYNATYSIVNASNNGYNGVEVELRIESA